MATKLFFLLFVALEVVLSQEEEGLSCDGQNIVLKCPGDQSFPTEMASRSPFFGDAIGLSCAGMGKRINRDEDAVSVNSASSDGGLTLNAHCPDTHPIISEFSFCLEDSRVRVASLNCVSLIDACIVEDTFNETSDDTYHTLVDCRDAGAIQGMYLMEADDVVTRVVFKCAKLSCDGEETI